MRRCLAAVLLLAGLAAAQAPPKPPYTVPVLVVSYFPVRGQQIDIHVTGDWGESLVATRAKTQRQTAELLRTLEEGSRYHGYKNSAAQPSLRYKVLKSYEYLQPLPTWAKPGHDVPMTDYKAILKAVDVAYWVEQRGVKEVWIWGYDGGKVGLWESNMAGPFGDISNSDRDPNDLPVLKKTYTVYHYNYQRGTSEATEDHIHQIEHVLNYVDGRDRTPAEQWPRLLFWGRFVGSDKTHKVVNPGCGWSHYPPNAEKDYDWANPRTVESDMEDWKPNGRGTRSLINSQRWGGDSLRWFTYWMQNLPGQGHGLSWQGKSLRNWWVFLGTFDQAMQQKWTLVEGNASGPQNFPPRPRARSTQVEGQISRSGHYTLPKVRGPVRIQADNVVVDFQGARLLPPSSAPQDTREGTGIEITSHANVTLKNVVVEGYRYNIKANNCRGLVLDNCRASRSRAQRVSRQGVRQDVWLALRDVEAWRGYGAGIWLEGCSEACLRRCSASAAQNGLVLVNCSRCRVTDNDFSYNSGWGVALWRSAHNEISWNHLDFVNRPWAGGWGGDSAALAVVNESHHNLLVGNSLTHGGDGFFLTNRSDAGFDEKSQVFRPVGSSDYNLVAYNDGSWAQANAFEGTFSRGNIYYKNQANDSNYGFWLGFSNQSWLLDNDVRRNRQEGIAIEQGRGNRLLSNRVVDTGGTAIHLWAVNEPRRAPFPSTDLELRGNLIERAPRALDLSGSTQVSSQDNRMLSAPADPFPFRSQLDSPSALDRFRASPEFQRLSEILRQRPKGFRFLRDSAGPRGLEWLEVGDFAPRDWRGHVAQVRSLDPGSCEVFGPRPKVPDWLEVRPGRRGYWTVEPRSQPQQIGEERAFVMEIRGADGRVERFPQKLQTAVWQVRWFPWATVRSFEDRAGWNRLLSSRPTLVENTRQPGGDFSYKSPRPGLPASNFALLATTRVRLPAGRYQFTSVSDDGLRVFLDGKEIISRWNHHGSTRDETTVKVGEGVHNLRVEYCQADGAAVLRLQWRRL